MKWLAFLAVVMSLVGCGSDEVPPEPLEPDLEDPATRANILEKALDLAKLERRGEPGEQLWHAVDGKSPYSGWAKSFFSSGQLKSLNQLGAGKLDGFLLQWHENGQKKKKGRFRANEEEGKWILWHSNGQMQQEGMYEVGKLMSVSVWSPSGEKCPVSQLDNGSGVVVWYRPDGRESFRSTYENGVEVARLPTVSSDDMTFSKKTNLWYHDVEREPFSGRLSDQYEDGAPKGEVLMSAGKKQGRERYWHPNGQLRMESHWRNGQLHGSLTEWDAEGKVLRKEYYAAGKKIAKP